MTFKEYIAQPFSESQRSNNVELTLDDVYSYVHCPMGNGVSWYEISIIVLGDVCTYILGNDSDRLYTTDGQGNKVKRSVFTMNKDAFL